jgi:alkaline phosphatase D
LLDFLDEPHESLRRQQKGVYWSHLYEDKQSSVKVILLDVRYFRDIPNTENADILGKKQWRWLESTLEGNDADLTLIVSGIQVLQEDHRYEKWAIFRKRENVS